MGTSPKLNMATSLQSRSKQEKLILLMMMMLENDLSVGLGSPVASEKTGERGFLYYFSRTVLGSFRRIL